MRPPATTAMKVRIVNGAVLTSSWSYQLAQARLYEQLADQGHLLLLREPGQLADALTQPH